MKKMVFKMLVPLVCLLFVSCGGNGIGDRMERLADDFEENFDKMTEEKMEKSLKKAEALLEEYEENVEQISAEQKRKFKKSLRRYMSLEVKSSFRVMGEKFDSLFEEGLPEMIDGLEDGFKEIEDSLDEAFDEIGRTMEESAEEVSESFEKAGNRIEESFEDR